ncbi:MAG: RDD family protein [Acidimicrobiales bacterium]
MTLATVGRRMAAFIIDLLLVYAVVLLVANLTDRTVGYSPLGFKFGAVGTLLIFVGALVYFVAAEAGFGATAGKAAAGIRVLGVDGGRIGFGRSIVRNLLRLVDAIPFVIPFLFGAIWIWNTHLSQRLGDRAARTVVVERHASRTFTPRPK